MKKFIDYFVNNSIIVNLITILLLIVGTMSMIKLNKETFPNVDFNFIIVSYPYPGAAAADVEKNIALDLEKELKNVDGILELNTLSGENGLITSIKVDPESDMDEVLQDTKDAVDKLVDLPEEVERPVVSKITNKRRALMRVALYGADENKLRVRAKKLQEKLEQNSNISSVDKTGYRDEQVRVNVSPELLSKYDISLLEIIDAIKDRQTNISAGNTKGDNLEKMIRTLNEVTGSKDVGEVVLRSNDIGQVVKVKDIAQVENILEDWSQIDRAEKRQAIFLDIKSKSSADVLKTSAFVKKILEDVSVNGEFEHKIYDDLSFYVKRRLSILTGNGIQGIILVTICLIFFLNIKVSIITALGAPFAFLVAFSLMGNFDITINLMSMFGLILVLGMLVDDSIIVSEQYYQNLEEGLEPKDAAKKAACETIAPVTSTVLTTIIAFGTLFYIDGIMGKFLWPVPAVVIICLLASWLECFVMLPSHLADFAKTLPRPDSIMSRFRNSWYGSLVKLYTKVLEASLKYSKTVLFVFITLFIASLVTLKTKMKFELFPSDDLIVAAVNIKGKVGTSLKRTEQEVIKIENIISEVIQESELQGLRASAGFQFLDGGRSKRGSHYGSIFIELVMSDLRTRSSSEILSAVSQALDDKIKEFSYSIKKFSGGPPKGADINVVFLGDSLEKLSAITKESIPEIRRIDGVSSLELDFEKGKDQIIVKIDDVLARKLNVDNRSVAMEIRSAFEGATATTIKKSDRDINVIVKLDESFRKDESVLKTMRVRNRLGQLIKLSSFASFEQSPSAYLIRRFNRKRVMALIGDVDKTKSSTLVVNKKISEYLDTIMSKYPDITYKLEGENKDTKDSFNSFTKALAVSVFLILILLVVQFSSIAQPVIIMSAIPFSFIGVIFSFLILGMPFGFMAMMGILGLVGVVVNDSIVLVSFINRAVQKEASFHSIVKATVSRFRPVILTTFTTVVGLLPIAHMPEGDPFLKPMATSFAYGLLFSSTITLIFVPCCYKVYVDIINFISKRKNTRTA